jgi:xanthine dehydrogenase small subunit
LTLSEIARAWTDPPECFTQWIPLFASPPIRNRATLAGNLATASPIGDGAPLLLALDARVEIAGVDGRRFVPLSLFFKDYRRTALEPGEMITALEIPKPLAAVTRFYKVAKRRMDDISTVAAAIAMDFDGEGFVTRTRFAFGGVAEVPKRVMAAEEAVVGARWNEASVSRARKILERELKPISDHRGSAEYRLAMAGNLIEKFFIERRDRA